MPTLRMRPICTAAVFLFVLGTGCSRCGSTLPEIPKPTATIPPTQEPTRVVEVATVESETPTAIAPPSIPLPTEPPLTATPDRSAEVAACEKAVASIASGDPSGLASLPDETKAALGSAAVSAVSCLAFADDKPHYCDSLPKTNKDDCVIQSQTLRSLKALPRGSSPLPIAISTFYNQCRTDNSTTDCDKLREAMTAGNVALCVGLPDDLRAFCTAVASGDISQCPPDSDCKRLAASIVKLKKEGPKALDDDPAMAIVRNGKTACTPLLAELKKRCSGKT